jgi:thiosulfate/3-mercaptopyruvate sulfurtransferase
LQDPNLLILEVRSGDTAIKFTDAHIPNAVFASSVYFQTNYPDKTDIPYDIPSKDQFEKLVRNVGVNNNSKVVIVYPGLIPKDIMCATRTYWTFDFYGMDNISILDGGLGKWKRENRSITNQIREAVIGDF